MKTGIVLTALRERSLDENLAFVVSEGVRTVEVPAGGYFPKNQCDPVALIAGQAAFGRFRDTLTRHGAEISAFCLHGNPFRQPADNPYTRDLQATCQLAGRLGVTRITLLGGLPPGAPGDTGSNWITATFPRDLPDMYRWQWEERLTPYWREQAAVAADNGVRFCFEMVPADLVYNPRTLLRLRSAIGPTIGCNFDPSHMFAMGMDVLAAVRAVGDAIYHVHMKDTYVNQELAAANGLLDPSPYDNEAERVWVYRGIGQVHDEAFWRRFVATLREVGYDDVLSIEHEDRRFSAEEGLRQAIRYVDNLQR